MGSIQGNASLSRVLVVHLEWDGWPPGAPSDAGVGSGYRINYSVASYRVLLYIYFIVLLGWLVHCNISGPVYYVTWGPLLG